jgi:catechol 2,3-dioxygenase-like lactoylglutathione lyase family enzyme
MNTTGTPIPMQRRNSSPNGRQKHERNTETDIDIFRLFGRIGDIRCEKGKTMKLKNVLIVVKDIERSRHFYRDLFGLETILDNDGNMILTEGLVLQEEKYWKEFLGKDIIPQNNSCELYFEESDLEGFVERLERYYPGVKYVNRLMMHSWGQKVIRFYDPDGNLIEVGTPM